MRALNRDDGKATGLTANTGAELADAIRAAGDVLAEPVAGLDEGVEVLSAVSLDLLVLLLVPLYRVWLRESPSSPTMTGWQPTNLYHVLERLYVRERHKRETIRPMSHALVRWAFRQTGG